MSEPTARDVGEFGLIAQVTARLHSSDAVLLGPGDDAAVLSFPDGRVVATKDLLVEGVHFRRDWSSAYDIGRKAAAANLADVAAMGGTASALLIGLAAPADLPVAWAVELADGLQDEAAVVGAVIVGGDTVRADQVVVSVTALGPARRPARHPERRGAGRPRRPGRPARLVGQGARAARATASPRARSSTRTAGPRRPTPWVRRSPPPARPRCATSATAWSPTSATSPAPAGCGSSSTARCCPTTSSSSTC